MRRSTNFFSERQATVSKAIYVSAVYQAPLPPEVADTIANIRLAQEFHWTLEYCESLTLFQKADIFGVLDGQSKVEKRRAEKAKAKR